MYKNKFSVGDVVVVNDRVSNAGYRYIITKSAGDKGTVVKAKDGVNVVMFLSGQTAIIYDAELDKCE